MKTLSESYLKKFPTEEARKKHSQDVALWQKKNKEKFNLYKYKGNLKRLYGITFEEYEQKLTEQNNSCEICGIDQIMLGHRLHVDHCHTTGKIRALLCRDCNTLLGRAKDDPGVLQKAAEYLQRAW